MRETSFMSCPSFPCSSLCYSSDRQLSLDLVNVGRQRLDFLPMLEHSGMFHETAVHTGTFAQEVITLVHRVKGQHDIVGSVLPLVCQEGCCVVIFDWLTRSSGWKYGDVFSDNSGTTWNGNKQQFCCKTPVSMSTRLFPRLTVTRETLCSWHEYSHRKDTLVCLMFWCRSCVCVCVYRAVLWRKWHHPERAVLSSTSRWLLWGSGGRGADVGSEVQLKPVCCVLCRLWLVEMQDVFIGNSLKAGAIQTAVFIFTSLTYEDCILVKMEKLRKWTFSFLQRLQFKYELPVGWWRASGLQTRTPAGERLSLLSCSEGSWHRFYYDAMQAVWYLSFDVAKQPVRGPGDLRHNLERRRQERLEGVKVTITGNNMSQHHLSPVRSDCMFCLDEQAEN